MAYQFSVSVEDGFDHYAPANAGWKYLHAVGAFTNVPGPVNGQGARFSGAGNYLDRGRGGAVTSRGAGIFCWIHAAGWGTATQVSPLALVRRTTGQTHVLMQACCVHPDGSVSVRRGAAWDVVVAASAAGVFPFDRWVYLEYSSSLWATGTPAQGRCDVRVGGAVVLSATGVQTCDALPRTTTDVRIGNCLPDGNAVVVDLDDFVDYFTSDTTTPEPGAAPFAGPTTVVTLYPAQAGDLTGFTAAGAPANWQANAEALGDGDTSYVTKTAGADPYDLYRLGAFGAATPALPVDDSAPNRPGFDAHLCALVRDAGGTTGQAGITLRYVDSTGTAYTNDYTQAVQATYQYSLGNLDPTRRAMETLQVGWGGPASVAGHTGDLFRGSQQAVELAYPAPAVAPPPAGGTRWSAGWVG